MPRLHTTAIVVLLTVTLVCPVVAYGYINGGFRSKTEAERYYADPANRKRPQKRGEADRRAQAEWWRQQEEQQQRQYVEQLGTLNAAIERDHDDLVAIYQRGKFFQSRLDRDNAMSDFDVIIARDPKFARAYYRRSFLWLWTRDYRQALNDLNSAIRLEPTYPDCHFHRALLLMACPESALRSLKAARQSAQTAVDLTEKSPAATVAGDNSSRNDSRLRLHAYSRELLAAIAAEMGDFPAAIQWETEAWSFPPPSKSNRLSLYESGRTDPAAKRESSLSLSPIVR